MEELQKLVESNAKAISFLTSDISEMKRDRNYMSSLMRDLTEKMGQLNSHQIKSYELIEKLDERQTQLSNQQKQLIEIQKSTNETLKILVDKISD